VARALDLAPTKKMRKGDLWDFRVLAILASLLDSPAHLMR
jgi:hypothetical protein